MGSYLAKDPRGTARYVVVASIQVSLLCGRKGKNGGEIPEEEKDARTERRERRKGGILAKAKPSSRDKPQYVTGLSLPLSLSLSSWLAPAVVRMPAA